MISFEIIKHQIGNSEVYSVNARDLHQKLEVRKDFSTWFKVQIKRGLFEENIDYITISVEKTLLPQKGEQRGGHNKIEYFLTLDTAKETDVTMNLIFYTIIEII